MISSISIGNFKAFADKQTLPIKPITLIFGANSSGKSSIIHSLLLTNEILTEEKLNLDIQYTKLGGESVDLGGFRQFVNRRDISKNVFLEIEFEKENLSDRLKEIFYTFSKIKLVVEFGFKSDLYGRTDELSVLSYELLTDGDSLLKMSMKEKGLGMDFMENENILLKNLLEVIVTSFTTSMSVTDSDKNSFSEGLIKVVSELTANADKLVPTEIIDLNKYKDPSKELLSPVNPENRDEIIQNITINLLPFIINEILAEISNCVNKEIRKIEYLGPLRSYPDRHFNFRKTNENNWKAGGGYAWDIVAKDKDVRDKVNHWLGAEKLKTQYFIKVIEMIPENILENKLPDKISESGHDAIAKFILNSSDTGGESESLGVTAFEIFEELKEYSKLIGPFQNSDESDEISEKEFNDTFKSLIEDKLLEFPKSEIIESFLSTNSNYQDISKSWIIDFLKDRSESISDIVLIDKNTNTDVSLRDVGIGISQVLPVLVSAFANKEKLIAIEQPEIHLHPALQAELGDVFINSALGENKNSFILETHSEHLILRIMRRIRETTEGDLPEGVIPIKPEDVQIVFVRQSNKGSEICKLEINEDGDFKTKWPEGFFEERAEELF